MASISTHLDLAHAANPPAANLTRRLGALAQRRRTLALGRALFYGLALAAALLLISVLLHLKLPRLPGTLWLALWLVEVLALLLVGIVGLRGAWRQGRLRGAVAQVERAAPNVEERFSSALELLAEPESPTSGSPELVAHLVRQAATAAQQLDADTVLPVGTLHRAAALAGLALLAWVVLSLAQPTGLLDALTGTLAPWSLRAPVAPPFAWTIAPGDAQVAQGDALPIAATADNPGLASVRSLSVIAHFADGPPLAYPMLRTGPTAFRYTFDNVAQPFTYEVRGPDDASKRYHVTVLARPILSRLRVRYEYPSYTRLSPRLDDTSDGAIEAPVGTTVTILVSSAGKLAPTSHLLIHPDSPQPVVQALAPVAEGGAGGAGNDPRDASVLGVTLRLDTAGTFAYKPVLMARIAGRDVAGLPERARSIHVVPDMPPEIRVVEPLFAPQADGPHRRVGPDALLTIRFAASDDYGLAKLQARVQVDQSTPEMVTLPLPPNGDGAGAGGGAVTHFEGSWPLAVPEWLSRKNLPHAKRLSFQLIATDTLPGPAGGQQTATPMYTLDLDPAAAAPQPLPEATPEQRAALARQIEQLQQQTEQARKQAAAPPPAATAPAATRTAQTQPAPEEDPAARRAREAEALDRGVKQLERDIQQAKDEHRPPVRPGDPENQRARELAAQAARQAREMPRNTAAQKSQAQEAAQETQAAKDSATQGKAEDAQRHLATASSAIKHANPAPAGDSKTGDSKTADNKTGSDSQPPKPGESGSPEDAAQQAQRANQAAAHERQAQALRDSAEAARQAQQEAGKTNPDAAQKLGQAAKSMEDAAAAERRAAAATAQRDDAGAQKNQQDAAEKLAQAQKDLDAAGQCNKPGSEGPQQSAENTGSGGNSGGNPGSNPSSAGGSGSKPGPVALGPVGPGTGSTQGTTPGTGAGTTTGASSGQRPGDTGRGAAPGETTPGGTKPEPGQDLATDGHEPAPGSGTGVATGGQPLPGTGSGGGAGPDANTAATTPLPDAVKEMGVRSGDWARLPPAEQQELLNAARQPGPPEYQEAIKRYYERIARMQRPVAQGDQP
jgi:hypothetical protein